MLENISGFFQNKDINITSNPNKKPITNTSFKNSTDSQKIILVSKGEAGYIPSFDIDGDGIITLEEFNEYCSENEISQEDKLKLLSVIQSGKMIQKLQEEAEKAKKETKEDKVQEPQKSSIYARRGDRKYDERMDENKDSVVTYEEYRKYCENIKNKENNKEDSNQSATLEEKEAKQAYGETFKEPEISVELKA